MGDEIENKIRHVAVDMLRMLSQAGDQLVDVPGIRGWVGAAMWGACVRAFARMAGVHIGLVVIEPGNGDGGDEIEAEPIERDSMVEDAVRVELH